MLRHAKAQVVPGGKVVQVALHLLEVLTPGCKPLTMYSCPSARLCLSWSQHLQPSTCQRPYTAWCSRGPAKGPPYHHVIKHSACKAHSGCCPGNVVCRLGRLPAGCLAAWSGVTWRVRLPWGQGLTLRLQSRWLRPPSRLSFPAGRQFEPLGLPAN